MSILSTEILISCYHLTPESRGDTYEFIVNDHLAVLECVHLEVAHQRMARPIKNAVAVLEGMLFELHHVRVNPKLNNSAIIRRLIEALNQIGVKVFNQPAEDSLEICYKPLGEISDNVRFYLSPKEGTLVFLSPVMKPKLVYSRKANR
jgi:hypothetical protein